MTNTGEVLKSGNRHRSFDNAVVIGGGLGGLAAAAYLADMGHGVTVLENRGRLGGRATTDERRGFWFNQGPHALYRGGAGMKVLGELGVSVKGSAPAADKASVLRNGSIHRGPADLWTLLRTTALSVREKLEVGKLLAGLEKMSPQQWADRTVDQWLDETLATEGARLLVNSLVRLTTYANQPDVLSADVAISQIQYGLTTGVLYLDRGWQQLVDQLTSRFQANPAVEIRYGERVDELPDAPVVIVATGDPVSSGRIIGRDFLDPRSAPVGPSARAACLDLGVSTPPTLDLLIGLDEPLYLSNHSAAADLAPAGDWHVACVRYLSTGESADRSELEQFSARGWAGPSELADNTIESRFLKEMTTVSALPIAERGGLTGRPSVADSGHDNVFLVGDWVGSVGHLADASLASAKAAALAAASRIEAGSVR